MSTLRGTRTFITGMPFSDMHFTPTQGVNNNFSNMSYVSPGRSYRWDDKTKYSNVSQICFGSKSCIEKRDAANAAAAAELAQQQAVLMQALNQKSGGLSGLAIAGIVIGILAATGTAVFLIHKHTI